MAEPEIRNEFSTTEVDDSAGGQISLIALLAADPANALEELAPGVYLARIAADNRWSVSGF